MQEALSWQAVAWFFVAQLFVFLGVCTAQYFALRNRQLALEELTRRAVDESSAAAAAGTAATAAAVESVQKVQHLEFKIDGRLSQLLAEKDAVKIATEVAARLLGEKEGAAAVLKQQAEASGIGKAISPPSSQPVEDIIKGAEDIISTAKDIENKIK